MVSFGEPIILGGSNILFRTASLSFVRDKVESKVCGKMLVSLCPIVPRLIYEKDDRPMIVNFGHNPSVVP